MATVYFIDGFDHRNYSGLGMKYTDNFRSGIGTANQGDTVPGAYAAPATPTIPSNGIGDSNGIFFINSGFGAICYTKTLAQRNRYVAGFHYKSHNPFGQPNAIDSLFFRWEYGSPVFINNQNPNTSLSIRQGPTNQLKFYAGGVGTTSSPGTLVANPSFVFTPETWYHVEVDATFGPGGKLKIYVNSTQVFEDLNVNLGTVNPDRFSIRHQSFGTQGWAMDDLYIADERLGRCRVNTNLPIGDVSGSGWTPTPSGILYSAIDDRQFTGSIVSPDSDITRIDATGPDLTSLHNFAEFSCYGRVLAAAINATAKKPSLSAPTIKLVSRPDPTSLSVTELDEYLLTTSYATYQSVVNLSPLTGGYWSDRELKDAIWGVRSGGSGANRVTAMFLEKLVSLEGLSYDCGAGSNSYAY